MGFIWGVLKIWNMEQFPIVSPGNRPLAKEPEDSKYEIGGWQERKLYAWF